jgi:MFS superfamily sulfate permease-like transporter
MWLRDKKRRRRILGIVVGALTIMLLALEVWAILIPTLVVAALMFLAAASAPDTPQNFRRWLLSKPLSFWIMTWFLIQAAVLTGIGTFFRGPGWSWVWPWSA